MKQNFDNGGFAQVQASILGLDETSLQTTVHQIRTSFAVWMKDTFVLSEQQQQQLQQLVPSFRQALADAVADSWQERQTILFYKASGGDEEEEPSLKDILLDRAKHHAQSMDSDEVLSYSSVAIRIVYR